MGMGRGVVGSTTSNMGGVRMLDLCQAPGHIRKGSPPHMDVERRSAGYHLSSASRDGEISAVSGTLLRAVGGPQDSLGRSRSRTPSPGRLSNRSRSREESGGVDADPMLPPPVLPEVESPSYVVGHAILNPFIPVAPAVQPLVRIVATSLQLPSSAVRPPRGGTLHFSEERGTWWPYGKGKKRELRPGSGRKVMQNTRESYQIKRLFPSDGTALPEPRASRHRRGRRVRRKVEENEDSIGEQEEDDDGVQGDEEEEDEEGNNLRKREVPGILSDVEGTKGHEEIKYVVYKPNRGMDHLPGSQVVVGAVGSGTGTAVEDAIVPGLEGVIFTPGENLLCVEEVCNPLDLARPTVANMAVPPPSVEGTPMDIGGSPRTISPRPPPQEGESEERWRMPGSSATSPSFSSSPASPRYSVKRLQELYHTTTNDVPVIFQGPNAMAPPLTAARVLPVLLRAEERVAELASRRRLVDWDISIPTAETIPPPAIAFLDAQCHPVTGLPLLFFALDAQTLQLKREETSLPPLSGRESEDERRARGTSPPSSPPTSSRSSTSHRRAQQTSLESVGSNISYDNGVHRIHGLVGLLPGLAEQVGLDRVMEYEVVAGTNELFVAPPYIDSEVGDLVLQLNATIQGMVTLTIKGFDCGSVDSYPCNPAAAVVQQSVNSLECKIKVQYSREVGISRAVAPPVGSESVKAFQRSRRGEMGVIAGGGALPLMDCVGGVSFPRGEIHSMEEDGTAAGAGGGGEGSSFVFPATNPHEIRYEECRQATREYIALKTAPQPCAGVSPSPFPFIPSLGGVSTEDPICGMTPGGGVPFSNPGEDGVVVSGAGGGKEPQPGMSFPWADQSTRLQASTWNLSGTSNGNRRDSGRCGTNAASRSRSPRGITTSPHDNQSRSHRLPQPLGSTQMAESVGDLFGGSGAALEGLKTINGSSTLGTFGAGCTAFSTSAGASTTTSFSWKGTRRKMSGVVDRNDLHPEVPASTLNGTGIGFGTGGTSGAVVGGEGAGKGGGPSSGAALAEQLLSLQRLPTNIGPCECMSTSIAFQLSHASQLLYFFSVPLWHSRLSSLLYVPPRDRMKETVEDAEGDGDRRGEGGTGARILPSHALFPSISPDARATSALFTGEESEKKREKFIECARHELSPILQDVMYAEIPLELTAQLVENTRYLASTERSMVLLRDLILVLVLDSHHKRCYRYHELVTLCYRLYQSAWMQTSSVFRGKLEDVERLAQWAITPEEERPAECWASSLFPSGKLTLSAVEKRFLMILENILRVGMWASFHIGAFKEGIFYATQRVYILCILHDGTTTEVCLAQKELAEFYAVFGDYFIAQQLALDVVALTEKLYDVDAPAVVEAQILSTICHFCANMVEDGVKQLHELFGYYLHRRAALTPRLSCEILLLVIYSQSTCSLFRQDYPELVLEDTAVTQIDEVIRVVGGEEYMKRRFSTFSSQNGLGAGEENASPLSGSRTYLYASSTTFPSEKKGRKLLNDQPEEEHKKEHRHTLRSSGVKNSSSSSASGISTPLRGGAGKKGVAGPHGAGGIPGSKSPTSMECTSGGSSSTGNLTRVGEWKTKGPWKGVGAGNGGGPGGLEVVVVEFETDKDPVASEHLRGLLLCLCGNLLIRSGAHTRGLQLLSKVFITFWDLLSVPLSSVCAIAMDGKAECSERSNDSTPFPDELKMTNRNNSGVKLLKILPKAPVAASSSFTSSSQPPPMAKGFSPDQELSCKSLKETKRKSSAAHDKGGLAFMASGTNPSKEEVVKIQNEGESFGIHPLPSPPLPSLSAIDKGREGKERMTEKEEMDVLSASPSYSSGMRLAGANGANGSVGDTGHLLLESIVSNTLDSIDRGDAKSSSLYRGETRVAAPPPRDPFGFCARLLWWISSDLAVWRMWSQPSSWQESILTLQQSASGMEEVWGPNHPFTGVVTFLLAQALQNSPHSNALEMAQRALAVFRRGVSPRSKYFLLAHCTLSRLYTLEHLWKEAMEHSNAALILGQLNFSTDDLMCQIEEDFLGCLLRCPPGTVIRLEQNLLLRRLQDRISHLERIYGLHSYLLVWPLVNLADAYYILRDMEAALTCLQRAVRLTDPKGALLVTSVTLKPSALLPNKDEVQRRNWVISTVLQTREKILQLAQVLFTMAGVLEATGTIADAQDCYCRCLGLLEVAGVERSLSAIRICTAIAKLLYSSKEYGDSLGWARKAERFTHSHYPEWVHERQFTKRLLSIVEHRLYLEEGTYVTVNPRNYDLEDFAELI